MVRAVLGYAPTSSSCPPVSRITPCSKACTQAGIDLWGEVELARQEEDLRAGRPWVTM